MAGSELPRLTEAGPRAVDALCALDLHVLRLLNPALRTRAAPPRVVTSREIARDVIYLLGGVPSRTFVFVEVRVSFQMGLSPHTVKTLQGGLKECACWKPFYFTQACTIQRSQVLL